LWYRADTPEIFPDGIYLEHRSHQVFVIAFYLTDLFRMDGFVRLETFSDRMPDEDFGFFLSMSINSTVPLFHDIRIPRDLDMDHVITVIL